MCLLLPFLLLTMKLNKRPTQRQTETETDKYLQVHTLLGLSQLGSVILARNLELFAHSLRLDRGGARVGQGYISCAGVAHDLELLAHSL